MKWDDVSDKQNMKIQAQCAKVAARVKSKDYIQPRLKIKGLFFAVKIAHKMINKSRRKRGCDDTKDYLYWKENGWLDGKKPWNNGMLKMVPF